MATDPALYFAQLERDLWRVRCETWERIVRVKVPALADWFNKQERTIFERARSAYTPSEEPEFTVALMMLYRALAPPKKLTGHGPKRRHDDLTELQRMPIILLIHFEEICKALYHLWRPKRGLATGINVLISRHLPPVYKRISLPTDRGPKDGQIHKWAKARSVDAFAYRLLAHARGMGVSYLRKVIARQRSERKKFLKESGCDSLPERLRSWRSEKSVSSLFQSSK